MLYDGVCGLCNHYVNWLLDHDVEDRWMFAPLQGETAAALRRVHSTIPDEIDTLVAIVDGVVYLRSSGVVAVVRELPPPWRVFALGWWIPWPLRDLLYRLVASQRYKIWGKSDSCRIPNEAMLARFLP